MFINFTNHPSSSWEDGQKKAAKEYPDDNLAIYTLATIYQALGREKEALKMFGVSN